MIREDCIKKVVSFGSVSSDGNGVLFRPNSYRLVRSRSDSDLSIPEEPQLSVSHYLPIFWK